MLKQVNCWVVFQLTPQTISWDLGQQRFWFFSPLLAVIWQWLHAYFTICSIMLSIVSILSFLSICSTFCTNCTLVTGPFGVVLHCWEFGQRFLYSITDCFGRLQLIYTFTWCSSAGLCTFVHFLKLHNREAPLVFSLGIGSMMLINQLIEFSL